MKIERLINNLFFIVGLGIIIPVTCIFVYLMCNMFFSDLSVTDIDDYNKIMHNVKNPKKIAHFPKDIPNNAKDVKFYYWASNTNGEVMLLQLKTDKKYITDELNRLEFFNCYDSVGCRQNIYHFPQTKGFLKSHNYTFFVLKNDENESVYKKYFPYFTGVGVDNNLEHIIYYYIEPDD